MVSGDKLQFFNHLSGWKRGWLRNANILQWMTGKKFLFTDGSKFDIYCRSKGAEECTKRDWAAERMIPQGFKPMVKHGGNIYLCTELTLAKEKYLSILERHATPHLTFMGPPKTAKAKHSVTSQDILWKTVKSCLENISHHVLQKLVESMPARKTAVIKQKGDIPKTFWNICIFFEDSTYHSNC